MKFNLKQLKKVFKKEDNSFLVHNWFVGFEKELREMYDFVTYSPDFYRLIKEILGDTET